MGTFQHAYKYVVVGGGVAAASAVQGIREEDPDGTIAVFGADPHPPVYRPDLSKGLWLDEDATVAGSTLDTLDADLHTGARVTALDPTARTVTLADGHTVRWDALLLATGSSPRQLDLPPGERVVLYRTVEDYQRLRGVLEATGDGARVVVVGGGYIGTEMAAALTHHGARVTMLVQTDNLQDNIFPTPLAQHVTADFLSRGVEIVHADYASGTVEDEHVVVHLSDGRELEADAVVFGVGVIANTDLAKTAGIALDPDHQGIVVDEFLRTSAPGVFAAGDVASYPDALLGRRRVEHVDAAESMGKVAGRNMAGAEVQYTRTPFFWSDLFDNGYEAVGETSTALDTVVDSAFDGWGSAVVHYLRDGHVRGVLLWNVWDSVPKALDLVRSTATDPVQAEDLLGRIPRE